jgi:transcriptional regulator with XRE-family HTH domain
VPRRSNAQYQTLLNQLGKRVQAAREASGLTQEKLAEEADLHPRTVQKIEQGQVNMPTTTLIRLRGAMKCRWKDLLPPEA